VFFPTFALTFVPSGVCTTLMEYPVSAELSKSDSVSLKMELPNSSSIMLRFFLRGIVLTKCLKCSCILKTYQKRVRIEVAFGRRDDECVLVGACFWNGRYVKWI